MRLISWKFALLLLLVAPLLQGYRCKAPEYWYNYWYSTWFRSQDCGYDYRWQEILLSRRKASWTQGTKPVLSTKTSVGVPEATARDFTRQPVKVRETRESRGRYDRIVQDFEARKYRQTTVKTPWSVHDRYEWKTRDVTELEKKHRDHEAWSAERSFEYQQWYQRWYRGWYLAGYWYWNWTNRRWEEWRYWNYGWTYYWDAYWTKYGQGWVWEDVTKDVGPYSVLWQGPWQDKVQTKLRASGVLQRSSTELIGKDLSSVVKDQLALSRDPSGPAPGDLGGKDISRTTGWLKRESSGQNEAATRGTRGASALRIKNEKETE